MTNKIVDMVVELNSNPASSKKFKSDPENAAEEFGVDSLNIKQELAESSDSNSKDVKGLMLTIHS
ncbi:MAG: hypothetical protein BM565_11115 [Gammaproteobacteria bacterium MedPE]|nr:MAG: hypothetical protein BM565_11115 [Gammaproteobacteria bacterium MedPE]